MKKLINYLPFHFLLATIIGIYIQFYGIIKTVNSKLLFISVFGLSLLLVVLYTLRRKVLFTCISWILFVFIGIISVYITNLNNQEKHYTRFIKKNASIILKIDKVLKSSNKYTKYTKYKASIIQIDSLKSTGSIHLNIYKNDSSKTLHENQKIVIKTKPEEISSSLNPNSFDYKDYLKKQNIDKQFFLNPHEYIVLDKKTSSSTSFVASFRRKIQSSLKQYHFNKDELDIINALILGQKQDISKELKDDYAKAGAIHILAISGLHIGILLLILSKIFHPLEKIKKGILIKSILVVISLWLFALLTGLSASVVRATTMFSFITIGSTFQKTKIIEHSLITSMLLMLLIQPMFIFDVGFQLSYLAVFGIIWVQPLLYNIWKPKLGLIDKIWQLITVSLAAQVGVLPISLYYFHQFPGLFLLSNIVIIPLLGVILLGGFIVVILTLLDSLPHFIITIYGYFIQLINSFVRWVSLQESFLFTNIYMSLTLMLSLYILFICAFQLIIKKSPKQCIYFLWAIVLLQTVSIYEKQELETKKELIVFHKYKKTIIGKREGNSLSIYQNLDSLFLKNDRAIQSYITGNNISDSKTYKTKPVYQFNEKQIFSIDSLGIYNVQGLKNPILHLQNNPKINLERVIMKLNPQLIIADGSNYKSNIFTWEKTCLQQKTPFHDTRKNGAFIIK